MEHEDPKDKHELCSPLTSTTLREGFGVTSPLFIILMIVLAVAFGFGGYLIWKKHRK